MQQARGSRRSHVPRVASSAARAAAAAAAVLLLVGGALAESAPGQREDPGSASSLRVTFVGDSVSASLDYVPSARRVLTRTFRMRFDLAVCRRLATPSCAFQGHVPTTALQAVRSLGRAIGDVLIVNVGYNEGPTGYRRGMDRVIRAARAQGARGVVWVTLREANAIYEPTNVAIRREAKRWRSVEVADWATFSRGRPWFRADGLHPNAAGAQALATLLRARVSHVVDPS